MAGRLDPPKFEVGKEPLRAKPDRSRTGHNPFAGAHDTSATTSGTSTTEVPWQGPDATQHPSDTQIPPLKSL